MKSLLLLLCLSLSTPSFAQEGVSTEIDPARLNEVMDWVNNAKFELDTGTEDISKSSVTDQEDSYNELITRVLQASGTKTNEFLMRNMLYRTQVVYKSIQNTPRSPKRDAYARRILDEGVAWSLKLYQADKSLLEQMRSKSIPDYIRGVSFATLGLEWTEYMFSLYYAVPDNKAKLQLMRDLMGLLYNDINNDDSVKRILAPISGRIASKNQELKNKLQNNPPKTPVEELALARELRRFIEQHIASAKKLLAPYAKNVTGNIAFAVTPAIKDAVPTPATLDKIKTGSILQTQHYYQLLNPAGENCENPSNYRGIKTGSKIKVLNNTPTKFMSDYVRAKVEAIYVEIISTPNNEGAYAQIGCTGYITTGNAVAPTVIIR